MKKSTLFFLCLLLPVIAGAQSGDYGNPSGEKKVLLAYENTRFKNSLIQEMVELLDDGNTSISVVDHQAGDLNGRESADYDAVFITNSGVTAKVRPAVLDWLEGNGGNPENVIVHTTQRTVWTPELSVDSYTSASLRRENDIRVKADEFVGLIREKLN